MLSHHPRYACGVPNLSSISHYPFGAGPHGWLLPQWPRIPGVQALFTTRAGGVSAAPFDTCNLGDHVGDAPQAVAANRHILVHSIQQLAQTPVTPVFLQQVHGCEVLALQPASGHGQAFDACVTEHRGVACTVMVADCLPVLLAHRSGAVVGAAHAGWRGLVGAQGYGVLEALWQSYAQQVRLQLGPKLRDADIADHTQVWLGPCIGPTAFEVGDDVRDAFVAAQSNASAYFVAHTTQGKWWADLAGLARLRWQRMGIEQVYGNDGSALWCTVSQPSIFFSHRRDAAVLGSTGRMAACIWKV